MDAMVAEGNAHLHRAHINIFFHFYSSSPLAHSPLLQEALLVLVLHPPDPEILQFLKETHFHKLLGH